MSPSHAEGIFFWEAAHTLLERKVTPVTLEELRRCQETPVTDCDPAGLPALEAWTVDPALPREQRLLGLLQQVGNPYVFASQGLTVKVRFTGGRSLTEALASALEVS